MNWKDALTTQGFTFGSVLYCGCGARKEVGEKWVRGSYSAEIRHKDKRSKTWRLKYYAQTKKSGKLTMDENEDALLNGLLGL